jgi:hypothetical protein
MSALNQGNVRFQPCAEDHRTARRKPPLDFATDHGEDMNAIHRNFRLYSESAAENKSNKSLY